LAYITITRKPFSSAVMYYIVGLYDNDEQIRECSAEAINQLNDSRALFHLLRRTEDEYAPVRYAIARALGNHPSVLSSRALISIYLNDDNSDIRNEACKSLVAIGKTAALEVFKQYCSDGKDEYLLLYSRIRNSLPRRGIPELKPIYMMPRAGNDK